ncbi:hypothetical protein FQN50_009196 [Emmonsiellopsis sp. PD_5]|nr:hypothetical protein FQN50_009196 [Emmonsiellopsis sp. PD_5]
MTATIEPPAHKPTPAARLLDKAYFYSLIPLFVLRLLTSLPLKLASPTNPLHWRQTLALTYLQSQRSTFPAAQITANLRRTPTGEGIRRYCRRHGIAYKSITLPPNSSTPQTTLHSVTPPSPPPSSPSHSPSSPPTLLYFHGGGYVNPLRATAHMPFVLSCAAACSAREVLFLEYGLAPEHRYPTQLAQAVAALRYLFVERGLRADEIVMAGDSAGAHLVGSVLGHLVRGCEGVEGLGLGEGEGFRACLFVSPFTTMWGGDGGNGKKGGDYLDWGQVGRFMEAWEPREGEVWADLCKGVGGREVWERVFPGRKDGGRGGLVKKAMVAVGTAEVFLESCREFASECVRAETVVAGRKTDWAVLDAVDFVLVECKGEAHVQPALDAAVGYQGGVMMRAILRWLASV